MKILKIKLITDYKMLRANTESDLTPNMRVDESDYKESLHKLSGSIYYPIEYIFVGQNSSGKTTILDFLTKVLRFLRHGRLSKNGFLNGSHFGFEALLFENNEIIEYKCLLTSKIDKDYLIIDSEELFVSKANPSLRKNLSNLNLKPSTSFIKSIGRDTSRVSDFFNREVDFLLDDWKGNYVDVFAQTFISLYNYANQKTINALIRLFDDSIEEISLDDNEAIDGKVRFIFKRKGEEAIHVTQDYLCSILSSGTIRGITLFGKSICAFNTGGYVIVDEIENSFHKNLIDNLRIMFCDEGLNKCGATLVFSTHYGQLLDLDDRWDNIVVVRRELSTIHLDNMAINYKLRSDTIKSQWFDQNAFGTLISYNKIYTLRSLMKG